MLPWNDNNRKLEVCQVMTEKIIHFFNGFFLVTGGTSK